ncbi:MAG: hypothetical protein V4638_04015 [Bacteroidota bacterium]
MTFLDRKKISLWTLVLLSLWILIFRATQVHNNELSWDVFGYYLPLEGTFIYDDPLLTDRTWVEEINAKHHVSDTLYQISSTPENEPMYFFLLGMSYMYAIFFFIAHFLAGMLGYAQDGLSSPYQYTLAMGMVVYTIIGLIYLRKILLRFFTDQLTSVLLLICVLGTNYAHHMTIKNLETVNMLFMFITIVIWNTIRWYEDGKLKNMLAIGVSITMMALIKPSEVLVVLIPLIWGLSSLREIPKRFHQLWLHKNQLILSLAVCFLIASPQVYYWYVKTGSFFYDSYKNPGVGLDFLSPHIYGGIFSYRKGWLVYTPIMIFALLGFIPLYKKRKDLFFGMLIPFLISLYIIVSWTEYWYGASFSNRPVIVQYPILLISLGFFLQWIWKQKNSIRYSFSGIVLLLVFLNLFQWWQFQNYIIDSTRMTKEYYWKVFLKTSVSAEDRELLLLERSYDPANLNQLKNENKYTSTSIQRSDYLPILMENYSVEEFIETKQIPFNELTDKDHCYAQFTFDYAVKNPEGKEIFLSCMMSRSNGDYGQYYFKLTGTDTLQNRVDTLFLTPEIRSEKDQLKFFIWNPNKLAFKMQNFKLKVLEPKK